jgi:anti-anti-sigma regulatory factor
MTCKIERFASGENVVVLRVCGRIQREHVSTIKDLILRETSAVALDLLEVTLVDRDVVNFLAVCERTGIELKNCPAFLREWVVKEQQRMGEEPPIKAP